MSDAARMRRLSLRFVDAELEAAFGEEQGRKTLRPFQVALDQAMRALVALRLAGDTRHDEIAGEAHA